MLRKTVPEEMRIDLIWSRLEQATDDDDRRDLRRELNVLLNQVGRHDEALQLLDDAIAEKPDDVLPLLSKVSVYHIWLDDPDEALACVDLALERAHRTKFWRRWPLGDKARILVDLRQGDALTEVLEQIMALEVEPGVVDIGRERDFVDAAPPGLIPVDVLARYGTFCPKRVGDSPDERPVFEQPEFGPDGREIAVTRERWLPKI